MCSSETQEAKISRALGKNILSTFRRLRSDNFEPLKNMNRAKALDSFKMGFLVEVESNNNIESSGKRRRGFNLTWPMSSKVLSKTSIIRKGLVATSSY